MRRVDPQIIEHVRDTEVATIGSVRVFVRALESTRNDRVVASHASVVVQFSSGGELEADLALLLSEILKTAAAMAKLRTFERKAEEAT